MSCFKQIISIISAILLSITVVHATEPIDINQATLTELQQIPSIGTVKAQAIINEREANGPFLDKEDLLRTPGIGPKLLKHISPYIKIEPQKAQKPMISQKED